MASKVVIELFILNLSDALNYTVKIQFPIGALQRSKIHFVSASQSLALPYNKLRL